MQYSTPQIHLTLDSMNWPLHMTRFGYGCKKTLKIYYCHDALPKGLVHTEIFNKYQSMIKSMGTYKFTMPQSIIVFCGTLMYHVTFTSFIFAIASQLSVGLSESGRLRLCFSVQSHPRDTYFKQDSTCRMNFTAMTHFLLKWNENIFLLSFYWKICKQSTQHTWGFRWKYRYVSLPL